MSGLPPWDLATVVPSVIRSTSPETTTAPPVAGERHSGIAGGVDRVGGIDTAHAAQIGCLALKTP